MSLDWNDLSKDDLAQEVVRLHHQRIIMACALRSGLVGAGIVDAPTALEIICDLGDVADHTKIEQLEPGKWFIEMPHNVSKELARQVTRFLEDGGLW